MPTYEYKCSNCGHRFEEVQSMKDPSLTKCPNCGNDTLARVIGGGGIIFKGTGFYQTDYKPSGAPAKETDATTTPAPATKTDSKPSTDSPAKKE